MDYRFGYFDSDQFEAFRKKLHSRIHWMLLYKDPKVSQDYNYVDFNKYVEGLMREINGLSALLSYPPEIINIVCNLEAAVLEVAKDEFDFQAYRKLILDAHALLDKIKVK